jgi:hypothetical protein
VPVTEEQVAALRAFLPFEPSCEHLTRALTDAQRDRTKEQRQGFRTLRRRQHRLAMPGEPEQIVLNLDLDAPRAVSALACPG